MSGQPSAVGAPGAWRRVAEDQRIGTFCSVMWNGPTHGVAASLRGWLIAGELATTGQKHGRTYFPLTPRVLLHSQIQSTASLLARQEFQVVPLRIWRRSTLHTKPTQMEQRNFPRFLQYRQRRHHKRNRWPWSTHRQGLKRAVGGEIPLLRFLFVPLSHVLFQGYRFARVKPLQ